MKAHDLASPSPTAMRVPGPLTTRVFSSLDSTKLATVGGAGGSSLLQTLESQDAGLRDLYSGRWPALLEREFVRCMPSSLAPSGNGSPDVEVAVCGGTLGILFACALQLSGHRVVDRLLAEIAAPSCGHCPILQNKRPAKGFCEANR